MELAAHLINLHAQSQGRYLRRDLLLQDMTVLLRDDFAAAVTEVPANTDVVTAGRILREDVFPSIERRVLHMLSCREDAPARVWSAEDRTAVVSWIHAYGWVLAARAGLVIA